jgi:hypothetical protein
LGFFIINNLVIRSHISLGLLGRVFGIIMSDYFALVWLIVRLICKWYLVVGFNYMMIRMMINMFFYRVVIFIVNAIDDSFLGNGGNPALESLLE